MRIRIKRLLKIAMCIASHTRTPIQAPAWRNIGAGLPRIWTSLLVDLMAALPDRHCEFIVSRDGTKSSRYWYPEVGYRYLYGKQLQYIASLVQM
ncbi:hypothetical protein CNYM01_11133 [Colletotrichum nymphaeae SA-01]|uniref:Uncharacterized protein n=1 Tax=Colletotrichum nymphaeae SA-01 TaxID=1460502 RepID=A0A135RPG2_9PEZI|nr:hypothetical protein CNYM01_11133 [Colletotrichum nymphaeae SA-01]